MSSNEIGTNVIFKKQLGLNYEIDQKYVGLKMKENNILSFNFRVPGSLIDEIEAYFKRFKLGEPIMVDIGGTGDIKCDFKGISPVLKNKDEFDQYFISATLQEDKQYNPLDSSERECCLFLSIVCTCTFQTGMRLLCRRSHVRFQTGMMR